MLIASLDISKVEVVLLGCSKEETIEHLIGIGMTLIDIVTTVATEKVIDGLKLVLEDNMTVAEVSKELSIHYNSLYKWISEYEEHGESAFPGHGTALYSYHSCISHSGI